MQVSAEAARRFLVARHFLAPARSLAGGPAAVLEVFRKLGSIQFDPIAVAGRNHDLVLHARVAGYDTGWCDELYERREIFEATNKALSFVPTSEFPWFRQAMGRKGPRFHSAALADNAEVAERVLERIRAEGPLSSRDFERETGPTKDWFGMPENAVRAAPGARLFHVVEPRVAQQEDPVCTGGRVPAQDLDDVGRGEIREIGCYEDRRRAYFGHWRRIGFRGGRTIRASLSMHAGRTTEPARAP